MAEVYIVSGCSGAGKDTLLSEALRKNEKIELIKSYTTRAPRNKSDASKYVFVSKEEFKELEIQDFFLESNVYNGNYYGTGKGELLDLLHKKHKSILLEIDFQGYQKILESNFFDREIVHSVFIVADAKEIFFRLLKRGTEDLESIIERMKISITEVKELKKAGPYDMVLVNNHFGTAVKELEQFLTGELSITESFSAEQFVKDAEEILEKLSKKESPFLPENYKTLYEYINENIKYLAWTQDNELKDKEYEKMTKLILSTYRVGDALTHNEYAILTRHYEKKKDYRTTLTVLGAAFANDLQSMSNYGSDAVVYDLIHMAEILKKSGSIYYAEKLLRFVQELKEDDSD